MKMKEGTRVVLPANIKEDWPEEHGVIIDVYENEFGIQYGVQVDAKYRQDNSDDGIRDCPGEIELESKVQEQKMKDVKTKILSILND